MSGSEGDQGSSDDAGSLLRALAATPEQSPDAQPGERVAHFRILGLLGRGGMGVVYRAHDETLRREIALKLLPETGDEERRQRFLREARSAAALMHPNVAVVHQVGEDGECVYIAMELVAGESLRQRLGRGVLDVPTALDLATQIARGLAAAHEKGIVHRDLKPENVMITPQGVVKLLDFGLAKTGVEHKPPSGSTEAALAKTETLVTSDEGRVLGTPEYMSPEQAVGAPVDVRSDVFAFGIVLYEMLTGTRPFTRSTAAGVLVAIARDPTPPLRERAPEVDARMESIVNRCLAKAPPDRFADAGELVSALAGRPSSRDASASATDVAPITRSGTSVQHRRPWLQGGLSLLTVVGIAAAVVTWREKQRDTNLKAARLTPPTAASAPTASQATRLSDLPLPKTDNPEALADYRKSFSDLYDATQGPWGALTKAIALDPTFAAAYLRRAFQASPPSSTHEYREAVRYREKLDDRDQALLVADEPCELPEVPDYPACKDRFVALARERPADIEILERIGTIESRIQAGSELATYERIARLDPRMAGAELGIAGALVSLGREEEAKQHLQRCQALSPAAASCIEREGEIAADEGRCEAFTEAARRASVIVPEEQTAVLMRLSGTLTTHGSREEADVLAEKLSLRGENSVANDAMSQLFRGAIAFWFGDFLGASEKLEAAAIAEQRLMSNYVAIAYEQLVAAEEMGDETRVSAYARRYAAERATETGGWDNLALRALRSHRVLPEAQIAALRDKWRLEERNAPGATAWDTWLGFDAGFATTAEEARDALTMPASSLPGRRLNLDEEYELGRLLLLAGRPGDATPHLERAARSCEPFIGFSTSTNMPFVIRAAFELGVAREALDDRDGACAAYRRLLERWGDAKPRSLTAQDARTRMQKLGCSP